MSSKLESPSAERNKLPIWEQVIQGRLLLPKQQQQQQQEQQQQPLQVLEVAAGSGVHAHFWAQQLAAADISAVWQCTDPEAASLASQEAYINEISTVSSSSDDDDCWKRHGTVQFRKPRFLTLDANGIVEADTEQALADASLDWIWNVNMIHISPWTATQGLMQMAGRKLKPAVGRLILYGPYRVQGTMVESNHKFEEWLKAKDPSYGVRNLEDVVAEAAKHGMELQETIEMPANNLSVILRKR